MVKSKRVSVVTVVIVVMLFAAAFFSGRASAYQPHMQSALTHLNEARVQLQEAEHDKAGHREAALDLVNRAITQVQLGIAAGRGH